MQASRQIIESRLDKLGVSSPTVVIRNGGELAIDLGNVRGVAGMAKTIDLASRS